MTLIRSRFGLSGLVLGLGDCVQGLGGCLGLVRARFGLARGGFGFAWDGSGVRILSLGACRFFLIGWVVLHFLLRMYGGMARWFSWVDGSVEVLWVLFWLGGLPGSGWPLNSPTIHQPQKKCAKGKNTQTGTQKPSPYIRQHICTRNPHCDGVFAPIRAIRRGQNTPVARAKNDSDQ